MRQTIKVLLVALAALALLAGCGNLLNPSGTVDSAEGTMLTIEFPSASRAVGDLFSQDPDIARVELYVRNYLTGLNEKVEAYRDSEGNWKASYRVMSAHYGEITFKAVAFYDGWWDEWDEIWYDETLAYVGSSTVIIPGTNVVNITMVTFVPTTFMVSGLGAYAYTDASLLVFKPGTIIQDAINEALTTGKPPTSMIAQSNEVTIDEWGVMDGSFSNWRAKDGVPHDIYIGIFDEESFSMTILSASATEPLATVMGDVHWEIVASTIYVNYFEFPMHDWEVSGIPSQYIGARAILYLFPGNTDFLSYTDGPFAAGLDLAYGSMGSVIDESGNASGILVKMSVFGGDSDGLPFWNPDPLLDYDVILMIKNEVGEYLFFGPGTDLENQSGPIYALGTMSGAVEPWSISVVDAVEKAHFIYPVPDQYEYDDYYYSASWINVGETQYRSLTYADVDWVLFYAYAGETYYITTSGDNPWWRDDNQMHLYDSSLYWLAYSNDYNNQYAGFEFVPPEDGYYYIRISGLYEDKIGDYTLTLTTGGSGSY